jgi:hypothetical protein
MHRHALRFVRHARARGAVGRIGDAKPFECDGCVRAGFRQTTAHPAAPADTRIAIILQRRPAPKKSGK